MADSPHTTVAAYLRTLDPARRAVISAVRKAVNANLPDGYRETMGYGMICWQVPLPAFPGTYNGQPLCYAGLAAQKRHNALYLMGTYGDPRQVGFLQKEFKKRGKKLDMGRSCLRFNTVEDLPLDVIGEVISRVTPSQLMAMHDAAHRRK